MRHYFFPGLLLFTSALSAGTSFAGDCGANLYLTCGDDSRQWHYLINGDNYLLIRTGTFPSYASSVEQTGYARCGKRYDKWTDKSIEYISVDGEINRTTGRYEPDMYTNVGCELSSAERYEAVKTERTQIIQALIAKKRAEEKAEDDALKSKRKF